MCLGGGFTQRLGSGSSWRGVGGRGGVQNPGMLVEPHNHTTTPHHAARAPLPGTPQMPQNIGVQPRLESANSRSSR